MNLTQFGNTDAILVSDSHLIQSFAHLDSLKQNSARTAIVSAEGAYVRDSQGNQLLDGIGGLWCVNVGHGRTEIINAIHEQLNKLDYYSTFYGFTHPPAAALAEKLAQLAPGDLNRVYFSNSGSVANDTAIRILHHYNNLLGRPGKKKILSRVNAYHGSTHLAIAMTTPKFSVGWDSARDLVHHLKCPHHYWERDNVTESEFLDILAEDMVREVERIGAENIACFIAEPIMGAGGVIVPPAGYHARMRDITRAYDIKYISDEVVTSFGRLGEMFASKDVFGIEPDIITTAKGLTSGYQPLAATIVSDEIYDVISGPDAMFFHGMTYSGHPAAAAAGLANIALIENDSLLEQVRRTGPLFETTLKTLEALDGVGEVRGSHFMMAVQLVADKETKVLLPEALNVAKRVADEAARRGLIIRPSGDFFILSPTLIMDDGQIETIGEILEESINVAVSSLRNEMGA
ncbi:adenosylmethionine-8-amino-7-oxononanoate aminotransferase [Labrenzia sp. EL_195]|nr:adenosylmethionine-8-amino-7-oxononanoate aminotransferase [Labrenzia sp. EL_195]